MTLKRSPSCSATRAPMAHTQLQESIRLSLASVLVTAVTPLVYYVPFNIEICAAVAIVWRTSAHVRYRFMIRVFQEKKKHSTHHACMPCRNTSADRGFLTHFVRKKTQGNCDIRYDLELFHMHISPTTHAATIKYFNKHTLKCQTNERAGYWRCKSAKPCTHT